MTYTNSNTYVDSVDTVVYAETVNEDNVVYVDVLVPGPPGPPAGIGLMAGLAIALGG